MEQEEKICDVETVKELIYLGNRVSAGRRCEAAVTARTRCWWDMGYIWDIPYIYGIYRKCGELLYGRFPLKLKVAAYNSFVRPAIL